MGTFCFVQINGKLWRSTRIRGEGGESQNAFERKEKICVRTEGAVYLDKKVSNYEENMRKCEAKPKKLTNLGSKSAVKLGKTTTSK